VLDAATGEPLERVRIDLSGVPPRTGQGPVAAAITSGDGRFSFNPIPDGDVTISATSIGYLTLREVVPVRNGESRDIEIRLTPDKLGSRESVDVNAGPFALETSPSSVSLSGSEVRNLGTVLMDDPLRAVQAVPGVVTSDEFQSQFAVRAAGYNRVGLFLDGILLHQPFHAVQGEQSSASITVVNGDVLDSLNLQAIPGSNFYDRDAAVIDARTREGGRDRLTARLNASMSNLSGTVEGPLGREGRGSWLISARKSYLQYLIKLASDQNALGFSFEDVTAKATYDVGRNHRLSALLVDGLSGLDRSANTTLGLNTIVTSDDHITIGSLGWRWTATPAFFVNHRAAWIGERYQNRNGEPMVLGRGNYFEWMGGGDGSWLRNGAARLDFGWNVRELRGEGGENRRLTNPTRLVPSNTYRGDGARTGGYLLPSWSMWSGRLQLVAGGRWDSYSPAAPFSARVALSPSASLGIRLAERTRLSLAWGHAAQYADIGQAFLGAPATLAQGKPFLLPERTIHFNAALEQILDAKTRVRVEAFQRLDRDLIWQPLLDPRIQANGTIYSPPSQPLFTNSARAYARGLQFLVQRRTANGWTGWVGYSYTVSRECDGVLKRCFTADFEQRHTLNAYASYRWRPTLNLSARWTYGSGIPLQGFFRQTGVLQYALAASRNDIRMPDLQRLDLRMNKTYVRHRAHYTLFLEVINVLNHKNYRADDLQNFDAKTGVAKPNFQTTFPILPSVGLMIEF
jgi:hypothetical protein